MKWVGEVGRVFAKDLRYSRWSILALVAAAALAANGYVTRSAFGPFFNGHGETLSMSDLFTEDLPLIIVVLGVMSLAMVVQSDRPLQPDSFWTTRPLSPTSVLVAKLLVAVMAIMLPALIAASVSLAALHTPRSVVLNMLARGALVELALLTGVIVVAVLTRDMKGFVAASVALLLGLVAGVAVISLVTRVSVTIPTDLSFMAPPLAIVVLAFLYRGQVSGVKQWASGVAVAILLILGIAAVPDFDRPSVPMLATGPRVSAMFGAPGRTSFPLPFSIRFDDASSARLAFARDRTVIMGTNGTRTLRAWDDTLVVSPQFPDLGRPIRWLTPPRSTPTLGQLALAPGDIQAVQTAATSAEVSGTVTILRPLVVANLPLEFGGFAERDGRFISIYGVTHDSAGASAYVHTVNPPLPGRHAPQFAIVNYERGEALLLDTHPTSNSGLGWVVFPWMIVESTFDRYLTNDRPPVPRDTAWYRGARLAVVEWIPVGRYHASARMSLR